MSLRLARDGGGSNCLKPGTPFSGSCSETPKTILIRQSVASLASPEPCNRNSMTEDAHFSGKHRINAHITTQEDMTLTKP